MSAYSNSRHKSIISKLRKTLFCFEFLQLVDYKAQCKKQVSFLDYVFFVLPLTVTLTYKSRGGMLYCICEGLELNYMVK